MDIFKILLSTVLLLTVCTSGITDTVQMKKGFAIEGLIIQETDDRIKIELFSGGIVTVRKSEVEAITKLSPEERQELERELGAKHERVKRQHAMRAREDFRGKVERLYKTANAFYKRGDYRKALKWFREVVFQCSGISAKDTVEEKTQEETLLDTIFDIFDVAQEKITRLEGIVKSVADTDRALRDMLDLKVYFDYRYNIDRYVEIQIDEGRYYSCDLELVPDIALDVICETRNIDSWYGERLPDLVGNATDYDRKMEAIVKAKLIGKTFKAPYKCLNKMRESLLELDKVNAVEYEEVMEAYLKAFKKLGEYRNNKAYLYNTVDISLKDIPRRYSSEEDFGGHSRYMDRTRPTRDYNRKVLHYNGKAGKARILAESLLKSWQRALKIHEEMARKLLVSVLSPGEESAP